MNKRVDCILINSLRYFFTFSHIQAFCTYSIDAFFNLTQKRFRVHAVTNKNQKNQNATGLCEEKADEVNKAVHKAHHRRHRSLDYQL